MSYAVTTPLHWLSPYHGLSCSRAATVPHHRPISTQPISIHPMQQASLCIPLTTDIGSVIGFIQPTSVSEGCLTPIRLFGASQGDHLFWTPNTCDIVPDRVTPAETSKQECCKHREHLHHTACLLVLKGVRKLWDDARMAVSHLRLIGSHLLNDA
jgi:hypothetical protein